jgi:transposase
LVVVMDGAASHRSKELNVPEHMSLLRLPPYSPELNPQECVWKELKSEGFYNKVFADMAEVEEQLMKRLRWFEQQRQRLKSLTLFPWISYALTS